MEKEKLKLKRESLKEDKLWTCKDVANFLGRSESAVRSMIQYKKIPYKKVGKRVCFSELAIREHFLG